MSRVGKQIIDVPSGVHVKIDGNSISVKGAKVELKREYHPGVKVDLVGDKLSVSVDANDSKMRGMHGVTRSQINNMVIGVTKGFEKKLVLKGVGYKVVVKNGSLDFTLGFSHPINMKLPDGIDAKAESPTQLTIFGASKENVGQVAANIKSLRPPEPYKGSGIRYSDERIIRKEGKTSKK